MLYIFIGKLEKRQFQFSIQIQNYVVWVLVLGSAQYLYTQIYEFI